MPVNVSNFTPAQESRIRELADQAVVKFLASNVPGYTDPATNKPVTYATAIKRGTTAYPYVITGGYLEKRIKAFETGEIADDAAAAQMAQQLTALQQLEQGRGRRPGQDPGRAREAAPRTTLMPDRPGGTMPKRVLRMAVRNFRTPAARYPADPRAVFILMMCVVAGIPLLLGRATPGSINDQLDKPQVITWGVLLVLGAGTTLIGMFRQSVNGVILEQVGSAAVGGACWIYAGAIWAQVGLAGAVPGLLIFGFGLACFWRWGQLQTHLRNAERLAQVRRDIGDGDE